MKAYNKEDIRRRFDNSSIKPLIKTETLSHPVMLNTWKLDKVLSIIIPGNPLADSRPKHQKKNDFFYNPHLANGIKLMKEVFNRADPERNYDIIIEGPVVSEINAYIYPFDHIIKSFNKDEMKDFEHEALPNPTNKKDSDNIEKLWWDCMGKFNIILLDEFICRNITQKFYASSSDRERLEIRFYYTDKDTFPKRYLRTLKEYLNYSITMKYKRLNNIRDDMWAITFYKNIANFYSKYKGKKDLQNIRNVLNDYKIDDLLLFNIKGTRDKIIEEILSNCKRIVDEINNRNKRRKKK